MRQTSKLVCTITCLLICCPDLSAQTYQTRPSQPESNSWQPPSIQYNPPPSSDSTAPRSLEKWWPNEPAKQDTNVRPANVEIALPEVVATSMSSDEVLNNSPDNLEGRSSGLLAAVPAAGAWGRSLQDKFAGVDVRKMFGSLAIVLGGYLAFVWLVRRFHSGAAGKLPSEVLDVVGAAPFGPRKNLQLVRLGSKLLLLLNGPEGTHPIGEITDPTEVEHLISICHGRSRSKSTDRTIFKNVMGRLQAGIPSATSNNSGGSFAIPSTPIASPNVAPSQPTSMQTAASNTTSELERIVQRLSSVVAQTNGRNVFEA